MNVRRTLLDLGRNINMRSTLTRGVLVMSAAAIGLAPVASANVVGNLSIGSGSGITVTLASITWNTDTGANPAGPPWNAEVSSSGTTLTFAGCPSGVLGTAGCLDVAPNSPNEAVEVNNANPLTAGTSLPESGFLLFSGNGTTHAVLNYTLTTVFAGPSNTNCGSLALFQSCAAVAGSPIALELTSTGTTATLNLAGTVTDGTGTTSWTGSFSATFTETPAQLQNDFCPGGVCNPSISKTTSNSGTFTAVSAVPEPGTMALIGAGFIGLSALLRRKRAARG